MLEILTKYSEMLIIGTIDTLYMTLISAVFAYILGVPMGVALFATKSGGISPNKPFNTAFGWIVNILRSIPFIILMISLFPLTRAIIGTIIGRNAAIVALSIAAAPFVARMIEQSLEEIDTGVIEAARCMGATNMQIILKVLLVESVPGIVRGMSITTITLIGYSAMAGAVGAGGLGNIGINYGYNRFEPKVMYLTVIILVVIVCVIQWIFNLLARKLDKRNQ
ncbi:MAG: methionine ABC transporter permease [Oscillospiraceae bacterium]